jgi:hypothetical protein
VAQQIFANLKLLIQGKDKADQLPTQLRQIERWANATPQQLYQMNSLTSPLVVSTASYTTVFSTTFVTNTAYTVRVACYGVASLAAGNGLGLRFQMDGTTISNAAEQYIQVSG